MSTHFDAIVGMSGGVDSSVAAWLLQQQGHRIAGLFMQNWDDDGSGECRAEDDRRDAVAICGRLGIPFFARNFARQYWDGVFEHFLSEYRAGRTPNPDILCNREIKFRTFLDEARALGAERIATGHYARVDQQQGRFRLLRACDDSKDQSYFLHALGQEALSATWFPLGELPKTQVRELARQAGFAVHAKKDSTGICFIGERSFRPFLARYLPAQPGPIRAVDGETLGEHAGVFYYTLGQREGLNLGGVRGRPQAPWFVVAKDVGNNVLYVDQGHDSPYLHSQTLLASQPSFTSGKPPDTPLHCSAKTRYRQPDQDCVLEMIGPNRLQVRFAQAQRAVTPGQSVVFYQGEECLGGAIIDSTDAPRPGGAI